MAKMVSGHYIVLYTRYPTEYLGPFDYAEAEKQARKVKEKHVIRLAWRTAKDEGSKE